MDKTGVTANNPINGLVLRTVLLDNLEKLFQFFGLCESRDETKTVEVDHIVDCGD